MGRRKKNESQSAEPKQKQVYKVNKERKKKDHSPKVIVKTTLESILCDEYKDTITEAFTERSIKATNICVLSSLLMLDKVRSSYERRDFAFFERKSEDVVSDCFNAILKQNKNNQHYMDFMGENFRELLNSH